MMFVVGRAPNAIEDVIAVGRASYLNGIIQAASFGVDGPATSWNVATRGPRYAAAS